MKTNICHSNLLWVRMRGTRRAGETAGGRGGDRGCGGGAAGPGQGHEVLVLAEAEGLGEGDRAQVQPLLHRHGDPGQSGPGHPRHAARASSGELKWKEK